MDDTYDVIIAGGGVMGCATAYYLLRSDNKLKVAIIEKDPTYARASTTLSDGNIRIQFNLKENIQISQYGLQVLENFAEEMAVGDDRPDVAFRRQGDLFLFDENGRHAAEKGFALQGRLGCEIEWLSPDEVKQRYPLLDMRSCAGGTFGRNEGTMDPNAVLQAYRNKAISLGAHFIQAEVSALTMKDKKISGTNLTSGKSLSSGIVVNSTGPWVPQIAQTVGIELPIVPVKRQVFVLETSAEPQQVLPLIVFPSGLYIIQEHGGNFLCGKSLKEDPIGYDDFSWSQQQFIENIWPELVEFVPSFDRLKITSGWAGLYAVNTLDGNAILGEWPEIKGLYLMGGFSGHGFQQCFAAGRYIAEKILGQSPSLDLSIFSPQRILQNRPVFESQSRLV
jgi:glycine/D-amino acid oxidase-like deaminating enzyme